MPPSRRVRVRRHILLAVLGGLAAGVALLLPGSSGSGARSAKPASRVEATTAPSTTSFSAGAANPGAFPQTNQLPNTNAGFQAHVGELWRAIAADQPAKALPFFFPRDAYVQVKSVADPIGDYQTRLIAGFFQDVHSLHAALGSSAALAGVMVPNAAQWILPGVENNKVSYWRVYGSQISYTLGGVTGSFQIASMISWRGEWYVVHLGAIR